MKKQYKALYYAVLLCLTMGLSPSTVKGVSYDAIDGPENVKGAQYKTIGNRYLEPLHIVRLTQKLRHVLNDPKQAHIFKATIALTLANSLRVSSYVLPYGGVISKVGLLLIVCALYQSSPCISKAKVKLSDKERGLNNLRAHTFFCAITSLVPSCPPYGSGAFFSLLSAAWNYLNIQTAYEILKEAKID